ncbi:hypothetical protein DYU11_23675 [Fibrisoma montanum]|uniref:Beta-galactosidase n=1 Tax=Fibrisoma montanum TaxID=2305895 RepID=A0A418M2Z9_9BACT|nr:DUF5597 domain-containing protein [Fibrisoma montanum]RIV19920.1 hypothetical protein DYU11_23675 [Fibrisoma montanum]
MKRLFPLFLLVHTLSVFAQTKPLPQLKNQNGHFTFLVDGKPFLMLGGQVHNSSAWPAAMPSVWAQAEQLGVNTLEVPIYWEAVEPQPGTYDFSTVNYLLTEARKRSLRLVLLWFASWKNGEMSYTPEWVKTAPQTYPRVINAHGERMFHLSPVAAANWQADARAFAALMRHLKQVDERDRTVIMVQVENEAGLHSADRDYSPEANRMFNSPVPDALLKRLSKPAGTWVQVFGPDAPELFSAWTVASYLNRVAEAGRREYALPLTANAWLREYGFRQPGSYPTGGPTSNVLDVWKVAAPVLDILAPDIYQSSYPETHEIMRAYTRPDNPLLIPESGGAAMPRTLFYALADYGAIGFAPFGFDNATGTLAKEYAAVTPNYKLLRPAIPVLTQMQQSGKLQAAVQEHGMTEKLIRFDGYDFLAQFTSPPGAEGPQGRVLLGEVNPDEFYLIGFNARFQVRPRSLPPSARLSKYEFILTVEEGTFDDAGAFRRTRLYNGDEIYFFELPATGSVLRVRLQRK